MSSLFYVSRNGKVEGPYTTTFLQVLKRQGIVDSTTNVCEKGTMKWEPYCIAVNKVQGISPIRSQHAMTKSKNNDGVLSTILVILCVLSVGGGVIMGLVSFIAGFAGLGFGYIFGGAVGGVLWYTLFVLLTKK